MKTVVGVLPSVKEARSVAHELEVLGIAPKEVRVVQGLGTDRAELKKVDRSLRSGGDSAATGALYGAAGAIVIGAAMLSFPGVRPFFAGSVAVTLAVFCAIGSVLSAVMAVLFNLGRPHDEAPLYAEAVREAGVTVAAHVNATVEPGALRVLRAHGARDLHASADWAWYTNSHPYPCDSNVTAH